MLLDGHTGQRLRDGKFIEFALYLDLYPEEEYSRGSKPETSTRINPQLERVEELHDLYGDMMGARRAEPD